MEAGKPRNSRRRSFGGLGPAGRRTLLKGLAENDPDVCSYCGNSTGRLFNCPGCKRQGCYTCMPTGPEEPCPECKEKHGRTS